MANHLALCMPECNAIWRHQDVLNDKQFQSILLGSEFYELQIIVLHCILLGLI